MNNESSNPNLEWKKTGFETQERITLKTNVKKAVEYDIKKKNSIQPSFSASPADLPNGLKKIRKKIRDVFDEEDEDENDSQVVPSLLDSNSSLINVLNSEEKKTLQQKETNETMLMQQRAGQGESLVMANKIATEIGLKGLNKEVLNKNMIDMPIGANTINNALKDELSKDMKLKIKNVSDKEFVQLLRGIKRIQAIGGKKAVEGMKLEQVVEVGKKKPDEKEFEQEVATKIMEKSGRKTKKDKNQKNNSQKVAVKQKSLDSLLEKSRI